MLLENPLGFWNEHIPVVAAIHQPERRKNTHKENEIHYASHWGIIVQSIDGATWKSLMQSLKLETGLSVNIADHSYDDYKTNFKTLPH